MVLLARLVSVCQDLGMFVECNKNQLCDYMTTGAARFSAHQSSPANRVSPAHVITGPKKASCLIFNFLYICL